jgi:hypothetical protein
MVRVSPASPGSPLADLSVASEPNRNDADVRIMKNMTENIQRYRAMGSLCRQRAVFDPQNSWKHLGDAERWEHLAHAEIARHSWERHAGASANPGNTRAKAIVAA